MRRMRVGLVLVVLCCGLLTGCGGSREKGKNQDYDRPRATNQR